MSKLRENSSSKNAIAKLGRDWRERMPGSMCHEQVSRCSFKMTPSDSVVVARCMCVRSMLHMLGVLLRGGESRCDVRGHPRRQVQRKASAAQGL